MSLSAKPPESNLVLASSTSVLRSTTNRVAMVLSLSVSALNQLPERKPSCFTPFTRVMPAANSGLSKPESAAS